MTKEDRQTVFCSMMEGVDTRVEGYGGLMRPISTVVQELDSLGFFTAPASTRFHGDYEGGLFDHSLKVTEELMKFTDRLHLRWQRPCSPVVVGMFHDLCKTDLYDIDNVQKDGDKVCVKYKHTDAPSIWGTGHGSKSVAIASTFIRMTPEEVACIRHHMGAYEKDEWGNLDTAIRTFPNVLWTHTADMVASKLYNT